MLAVQFASFVADLAKTVIKTGGKEKNLEISKSRLYGPPMIFSPVYIVT